MCCALASTSVNDSSSSRTCHTGFLGSGHGPPRSARPARAPASGALGGGRRRTRSRTESAAVRTLRARSPRLSEGPTGPWLETDLDNRAARRVENSRDDPAPRRADPSSWRTWSRICISDPTTRIAGRVHSRCNWSRKRARRWRPRRRARAASTTSTNGPARPRASRWRVGRRRRGPGVRRRTGRWRSPGCWKDATPTARGSPWCATTSTRTRGAFYEVFEPVRARELVRRLEFCYTPKHGSWLNAENELSAMTRQCLSGRRIGDLATLHGEVSAWSSDTNDTQRGVDWQMKVDDARCKLKSVYPKILM